MCQMLHSIVTSCAAFSWQCVWRLLNVRVRVVRFATRQLAVWQVASKERAGAVVAIHFLLEQELAVFVLGWPRWNYGSSNERAPRQQRASGAQKLSAESANTWRNVSG